MKNKEVIKVEEKEYDDGGAEVEDKI